MKTSDLSQCQSCVYHYTYEGQDMCRQVGDDFYLQRKIEDCPKYSSIGDVLCSEPVYQLKHELRSKIEYIHEQDEVIKEYKHRAEVAEKELLVYKEVVGAMLSEIDCFNEGYCPEFYKDPECENCIKKKIYGNSAATFPCLLDKYIRQAEKELAEERKDD